jgi:antitoxin (DNA-binding transcriptional repressor) of toxin-antitoxin stability system
MRFKVGEVTIRTLRARFAAYMRKTLDGRRFKIFSHEVAVGAVVPIDDLKVLHALVGMSDRSFRRLQAALALDDEATKGDRSAANILVLWKDKFDRDKTKPIDGVDET